MSERTRVGELRTNQLLHTFGVGALIDLPNVSVVVRGLDAWKTSYAAPLQENRLLALVQKILGPQVSELRSPPYTPSTTNVFDDWTRIGVPVGIFPRWLRCTSCQQLASVDSGLFDLLSSPYQPDRTRYVHHCKGGRKEGPLTVPARFVLACQDGHLDDFPWMYFVHDGHEPTGPGHTLKLAERGTTGEAAGVYVQCEACPDNDHRPKNRSMGQAFDVENSARNLPRCRGRHPHLGTFEECHAEPRAMVLGATNGWFPIRKSVFSLPEGESALGDAVARHMDVLRTMAALPEQGAEQVFPNLAFWPELDEFGFAKVWEELQKQVNAEADDAATDGPDEGEPDTARPEWEALIEPRDIELPDFTTRRVHVPPRAKTYLDQVVLVPRLREVSALYGFTRVDAPEFDPVHTDVGRIAPISAQPPTWVPCAEQRGEGIFLRFAEEPLAEWAARPSVRDREQFLRRAHERWRRARNLPPGEWPGIRYVLLHSLAHCLIREVALEAGYSAAGIAEKVYADDGTDSGKDPMAGILLYTAAPDSEGTLGGLVSLAAKPDRFGPLLEQALDAARLCSSDPLCAEHDPNDHARLYGAACHVCLFASETSCARNNHYLDRALVVRTIAQNLPEDLGYFA